MTYRLRIVAALLLAMSPAAAQIGPLPGSGPLPIGGWPICVGGTVTQTGNTRIHVFTTSGILTCNGTVAANYLVVGGAGSGSIYETGNGPGGAGGAGGVVHGSTTLTPGNYAVTIGAGGTASGGNGQNSVLTGIATAIGGGTGGQGGVSGSNGGSGGGAGSHGASPGTGTGGQGNSGGASGTTSGGGGGGCNTAGTAGSGGSAGGAGGNGCSSSITGSAVIYGGGGGGGGFDSAAVAPGGSGGGGSGGSASIVAAAGTANTGGGGGGGGGFGGSANGPGGNGGSGVVVVSYTQ